MNSTSVIRSEFADGVTTITALNRPREAQRPQHRVAGERFPRGGHPTQTATSRCWPSVLTGADQAFCADLDLQELGSTAANLSSGQPVETQGHRRGAPWPVMTKPVIGAINGAAVTGGLEVALQCDFLIASERAGFADTHARVGVMPAWGLTVLLPQAIGLRRAKEMSLTGNFVGATEALALGLVNRGVVPHHGVAAPPPQSRPRHRLQ